MKKWEKEKEKRKKGKRRMEFSLWFGYVFELNWD